MRQRSQEDLDSLRRGVEQAEAKRILTAFKARQAKAAHDKLQIQHNTRRDARLNASRTPKKRPWYKSLSFLFQLGMGMFFVGLVVAMLAASDIPVNLD